MGKGGVLHNLCHSMVMGGRGASELYWYQPVSLSPHSVALLSTPKPVQVISRHKSHFCFQVWNCFPMFNLYWQINLTSSKVQFSFLFVTTAHPPKLLHFECQYLIWFYDSLSVFAYYLRSHQLLSQRSQVCLSESSPQIRQWISSNLLVHTFTLQ